MGGLLYKDFLSINGKKQVAVISVFTVLLVILKLIVAFADTPDAWLMENSEGEVMNFLEYLVSMPAQMLPIMCIAFIAMWIPNVIQNDEKSKIYAYLSATPLSKRTYIAEKYVFIGICIYSALSICMIWCVISMAFLQEGAVLDILMLISSFLIELFSLALIGASIEFPVFVAFGKEKGQMIKTGILEVLAWFAVAFLFFGNLDVFEKVDFNRIIEWAKTHSFALMFMAVISPLITLCVYYISYRISVRIYERKEREHE
ncbi:MAG: ABC-2 transporter permease [Lachnospiraceae bacterium]|nr:ABC-2 transporter permease [Lachnospiraceae bacterium]